MAKTEVSFNSEDPVMEMIRIWTHENKFKLEEKGENRRLYKRGWGDVWFLEVEKNGNNYTLTAWIKQFAGELALTGFYAAATKRRYRKEINKLLNILDEPGI